MPCFGTAVVTARLGAETWEAVKTDERVPVAIAAHLQQQTGLEWTYTVRGADILFTTPTGGSIQVGAYGVRDYAGSYGVPVDVDGLAEFINQLGMALSVERLVSAIGEASYVESDAYDEAGNRVLMVSA